MKYKIFKIEKSDNGSGEWKQNKKKKWKRMSQNDVEEWLNFKEDGCKRECVCVCACTIREGTVWIIRKHLKDFKNVLEFNETFEEYFCQKYNWMKFLTKCFFY